MLADNVDIFSSDTHPIFDENNKLINHSKPIEISDHVWIGLHSKILKGVCVGEGAIIGMASLVTKNIMPHTLNVGAPAKCIKEGVKWSRDFITK